MILWKLSRLEGRWWDVAELTQAVTTPELRAAYAEPGQVSLDWLLDFAVFCKLRDFGLLELDLDSWSVDSHRFRPTPLLPTFLRWSF